MVGVDSRADVGFWTGRQLINAAARGGIEERHQPAQKHQGRHISVSAFWGGINCIPDYVDWGGMA